MKIIYYSPHPTHDIVSEVGYATHQREVINALKGLGHEVIPVIMGGTEKGNLSTAGIPAPPNSLKARIKKLIPRVIWTSIKDYLLIRHDKNAAMRLEEAIIKHKPDLVYERSEYLQDKGVKVIKKYGIRYFLEINAPFSEEMKGFEGNSIWHGLAEKKEFQKNDAADKIFVVSSALRYFIEERYKVDPKKIIVQPNCINPDKVCVDLSGTKKLKEELKLSGKKVIGFVGSIFPHHGVDILIDAFGMVVAKKPQSKLIIVGDGSIMDELKRKVNDNALTDSVVFTGNQQHDKVFNYISLMDICVMAKSNWYGSPIKIFEYGAMRKPVIAPVTVPVKDVMQNEVHGLLVEMNANNVAEAINRLLDHPELAEELAGNFYRAITDEYTWQKAAQKIIASYNLN